jgi:lysozyme
MIFNFLKKNPKKAAASGVVVALALPFTAYHEGLRLKAYLDPIGIPTICYGETLGVEMGQEKTKAECDALFEARLGFFAYAVDAAISPSMSPYTHAALTSWTYNVGIGAMQKSTLVRLMNEGRTVEACNELPKWNKAGGRVLPGLVKRREDERKLCLQL